MAFITAAATAVSGALTAAGVSSTALSLTGTVVSTIGTLAGLSYQARVAKNQAIANDQAAEDAIQRGQIEQQEQDFAAAEQLGQQTAQLATSGFDVTAGSLGQRRSYTRLLARRDALRIRNNAEREAVGFRNQAQNNRDEAAGFGTQQIFTAFEGAAEAGGSLIGEATMVNRRKARTLRRSA